MEITRLSTKGQVVIPEGIRKGVKVGTPFAVAKEGKLIILKEIEGLTKEEIKEMKELDKIWKDIDKGNGTTLKVEEFLKEMNEW